MKLLLVKLAPNSRSESAGPITKHTKPVYSRSALDHCRVMTLLSPGLCWPSPNLSKTSLLKIGSIQSRASSKHRAAQALISSPTRGRMLQEGIKKQSSLISTHQREWHYPPKVVVHFPFFWWPKRPRGSQVFDSFERFCIDRTLALWFFETSFAWLQFGCICSRQQPAFFPPKRNVD